MQWEAETQQPLCQKQTIYNLHGKHTMDPEAPIEILLLSF